MTPDRTCSVVTWNIAAVNNNPFEYWITHPDPEYNALMKSVQELIDSPGLNDVRLDQIFTNAMVSEFMENMKSQMMNGVDEVEKMWLHDYSKRKGIHEFLLDKSIGVKRLISMPDRITNTIHNIDRTTALRPSVISAYEGDLSSVDVWWKQWNDFVFKQEVNVLSKNDGEGPKLVCQLIEPILRSKYPAITAEEQAVSIPLQLMCLALFDAVLVRMLNLVAKKTWQSIKRSLCNALIKQKSMRTVAILAEKYSHSDIIFIQEAAAALQMQLSTEKIIWDRFIVLKPSVLDGKRDQNSFILASKEMFEDSAMEISDLVLDCVGGTWVAPGDLLAVTMRSRSGEGYLLASFHGDSNGLSTQPFVEALARVARTRFPTHRVVVGLDANTLSRDEPLHFTVAAFRALLKTLDLASCWGSELDPAIATTCNARTCLQAQVNKAVRFADRLRKGQRNLKDWVIFSLAHFDAGPAARDNTGDGFFMPDAVFPTMAFPSDHALVSVTLTPRPLPLSADFPDADAARNGATSGGVADGGNPAEDGKLEVVKRKWPGSGFASRLPSLSHRSSNFLSAGGGGSSGATLYDYWHIVAKPEELRVQVQEPPPATRSLWSPHDRDQQDAFLREQYLDVTARPPDALDRINWSLSAARDRASAVWVLFTSSPLSLALTKPKVILALACPCLCIFAWVGLGLYLADQGGLVDARFRRFTVQGSCAGDDSGEGSNLTGIVRGAGLLAGGQPVLDGLLRVWVENHSVIVASNGSVASNGWWLRADPVKLQRCPLRFTREFSDDGSSWKTESDPVWQVLRDGD